MMKRSVTLRLLLAVVGLEVTVIAALAAAMYFESAKFSQTQFDTALAARAASMTMKPSAIAAQPESITSIRPARATSAFPWRAEL